MVEWFPYSRGEKGNSLKEGDLLTKVLDALEKVSKIPRKKDEDTGKLVPLNGTLKIKMIDELKEQGINCLGWDYSMEENSFNILYEEYDNLARFHLNDSPSGPYIDVPMTIFGGRGFWLEDIAALAIVEGWGCERVYVGVCIGDYEHKERMGCLKTALKRPNSANLISRVWSDCHTKGILPQEFSGLDFLDSNSFDRKEYSSKHLRENSVEIGRLVGWIVREWSKLPANMRNYLTEHCKNRDLDVFAETSSQCLFVECKLTLGRNSTSGARDQLNSLMASSASRGINYSILTHADLNKHGRRSGDFDFTVPWNILRRPGEMLKSVIKRKKTPPPPDENDSLAKEPTKSPPPKKRRRRRRNRSKSRKKDESSKNMDEPRWGAW